MASLLGLGALGAGGYAVFATNSEAGPVALLAIGFLFALIGMSGKLPNRIKLGENEASWEQERAAAQAFAEQVVEQADDGQHRIVAIKALEDLNEAAPQVAGPALSALLYEALIIEMLGQLAAQSTDIATGKPSFNLVQFTDNRQQSSVQPIDIPQRYMVDALLVTPNQLGLAVEISGNSAGLSGATLMRILERFQTFQEFDPRVKGLLVIARNSLSAEAVQIAMDGPEIHLTVIKGPEDARVLALAVRKSFARIGIEPE